jgi:hypothetical protein
MSDLDVVITIGDEAPASVLDRLREAKRQEVSASAERRTAIKDAIRGTTSRRKSYHDIGTNGLLSLVPKLKFDTAARISYDGRQQAREGGPAATAPSSFDTGYKRLVAR